MQAVWSARRHSPGVGGSGVRVSAILHIVGRLGLVGASFQIFCRGNFREEISPGELSHGLPSGVGLTKMQENLQGAEVRPGPRAP